MTSFKYSNVMKMAIVLSSNMKSIHSKFIPPKNSPSSPGRSISLDRFNFHQREEGYWKNPCGIFAGPSGGDEGLFALSVMFDKALNQVDGFKEEFTQDKFHRSFNLQYEIDKNEQYLWLLDPPIIVKDTGEHLSSEYYQNLKLDSLIIQSYQILQRFAVGFEEVTSVEDDYSENFRNLEINLRGVLCSLYRIANEMDLTLKKDADRDVMPDDLKGLQPGLPKDLRDFRILKLYINVLEYYADGLKYLSQNLPPD